MNTKLIYLNDDFRLRVRETLRVCQQDSLPVLVYCTLRTCSEQARLYRRTRTLQEINRKIQSLRDRGFPFLADSLEAVGPQAGPLGEHVTKAGPGESWHQYGLAADCVPLRDGKPTWRDEDPEWKVFGASAKIAGLYWAGDWQSFRESPHIQMFPTASPLSHYRDPSGVLAILRDAGTL